MSRHPTRSLFVSGLWYKSEYNQPAQREMEYTLTEEVPINPIKMFKDARGFPVWESAAHDAHGNPLARSNQPVPNQPRRRTYTRKPLPRMPPWRLRRYAGQNYPYGARPFEAQPPYNHSPPPPPPPEGHIGPYYAPNPPPPPLNHESRHKINASRNESSAMFLEDFDIAPSPTDQFFRATLTNIRRDIRDYETDDPTIAAQVAQNAAAPPHQNQHDGSVQEIGDDEGFESAEQLQRELDEHLRECSRRRVQEAKRGIDEMARRVDERRAKLGMVGAERRRVEGIAFSRKHDIQVW